MTATIHLQILTGRTHQIRYHLSHHGLPIVGDYLYNPSWITSPKTNTEDKGVSMQLTAYKMLYQDMDGSLQTVEI
jgi:23S rRNA-/tRNA-specific pseudouridylate synthase